MRKLASIQRILEIAPIEGADNIEVATIMGWKCVVPRNQFHPGDYVVWFEIDSWIPTQYAPFLTKTKEPREFNGVKGERLRTVKLRKQVSQGLVLSLNAMGITGPVVEGADLTAQLGILKWEPPIPGSLAGVIRGSFPSFVKKTDEERIQNLTWYFERYRGMLFEASIKLDGSSCTIYSNAGDFGVCSRNMDLKEDENNSFWKVALRYNLREEMARIGRNVAIQGELIGPGIQKNRDGLTDIDLYVFNVWDIDQHRHMTPIERKAYLAQIPTLKSVPVLNDSIDVFSRYPTMAQILEYAGAGGSLNAKIREGLVFKSLELVDGDVVSFKVINNNYLLDE